MLDKPLNVLLIEDDANERQLIQDILAANRRVAVHVTSADRLSTGLQYLQEGGIDVILLDLSLPDSQGMDTFFATRAAAPTTPVIILTDGDHEEVAMSHLRGVHEGALDYLVKSKLDGNVLARVMLYGIERQRLLAILEQARRIEQQMVSHDALTGLPNRQLFYDRLQHTLALAKRHQRLAAILFLDLDGFKHINDTLGHSIGDLLLQVAATRLKTCTRESDTLARLGGDEFAVIFGEIAHEQDAARVAEKILATLSAPYLIHGHELFTTTSIGITLYPADGSDLESLVKSAEIAMYRAKSDGKNNYRFYNQAMEAAALQRLSLETSLRKAIEQGKLVLHYQPQVDLRSEQIVGVEALVRWHHPDAGLISPAHFIPLAEETGLILPMGDWVLRTACEQNRAWQKAGFPPFRMAVNLSARQFQETTLPKKVAQVLAEADLSPNCLALEITESSVIQNVDYTIATLKKLKAMGVQLALDDFGTGYSSLSFLKRFPIDKLKVDRSFVQGVPYDRGDMAITTTIVGLAQSMELKVIAEGVETEDQLGFLRSLRCDEMQGYLFSRPLPVDAFENLLHTRRPGNLPRSDKTMEARFASPVFVGSDESQNYLPAFRK
jgi:diguanylate cyclase (GGDEF)-like protein